MTRLRRQLLVPAVVVWGCLAWLATIGVDPPLDPTADAWRFATGRMLLVMVAGTVIVWPTTVLLGSQLTPRDIAMESITIAILLGAATAGLLLPAGVSALSGTAEALLLANWVLFIGGACALAGPRRGILATVLALMIAALPLGVFLPEPWALILGPLAAAWAIARHDIESLQVWLALLWPAAGMTACWVCACREALIRRVSPS